MLTRIPSSRVIRPAVFVICICGLCNLALGGIVSVATPTDDAFVSEAAPTLNYGVAGGLSVAGPGAVNGQGDPQGRFDSILKFDVAEAVATFDSAYGAGNWEIDSVDLEVGEQGAPNNPIFNRGVGEFELFWLDDDSWIEGPGRPNNPPEGSGNEITWNLLQTMLGAANTASLGIFANEGTDGGRDYELGVAESFVNDLISGGLVSLYAAPVSDTMGFTFNSVNNTWGEPPQLVITAVPEPGTIFLVLSGLVLITRRTGKGGRAAA